MRTETIRSAFTISAAALLLVLSLASFSAPAHAAGKIVFGWVTFDDTRWPAPYNGGNIPADSLPWEVLTHVGLFAANGNAPPQSYYVNQYGAFTARAHQAGVYAGITVGGSSDGALVSMVADPAQWTNWINTYLGYIDQHRMDFIEFDFEGSYSETNMGNFFSQLYDSLQTRWCGNNASKHPYIVLTASVSHAISWNSQTIQDRVEFVNLMTYDYNNNAWGRVTFDNSPMSYKYYDGTGGATDSVGSGTNAIAPSMQRMAIRVNAAGWPRNKLTVGVDFNGGAWSGATMIRQSTSGTSSGGSNATFANQWDSFVTLPSDSIFFDQIAQAYWFRLGGLLWTMISMPGRDSGIIATRKVIDSMGLGGVCIWNLGNEVWNSSPTPPGGRGWFFSQIRQHFNFGPYTPPPPPPPPGTPRIKGKVYFDGDQNGSRGGSEPAMAGWTVRLSGAANDVAITDSAGTFDFTDLPLGAYTLSVDGKALWTQTSPASGAAYGVTLAAEDQTEELDFGAWSPSAFHFPVSRNWNIVSVPVLTPDLAVTSMFPLSNVSAYSFHSGEYAVEQDLETGEGYWMKFTQGHDVWMAGPRISAETVNVETGWNFIGSVSNSLPVSDLVTIPPGLLSRYIYGFDGGSFLASEIEPGKGYWVVATAPGMVVISDAGGSAGGGATIPRVDSNLNELVLVSATGERQGLYFSFDADATSASPAPPSPPGGSFSALFRRQTPGEGGTMVELMTHDVALASSLPVVMANAALPMSLQWKIAPGNHAARLSTGSGASVELTGTGRIDVFTPELTGSGESTLFLTLRTDGTDEVPGNFDLGQNYPNPFNGTTIIPFSLVTESRVTIDIFNVLGEKVLTLVDRTFDPGVHSASLASERIPTGVFLYRITAENAAGNRFVAARKLLHVK